MAMENAPDSFGGVLFWNLEEDLACSLRNHWPTRRNGSGERRSVFLSVRAGGSDSFSFGHGDGLACGHAGKTVYLAAGPANFDGIGLIVLREPESQDEFAGGKIAGTAAKHLRLRFSTGRKLDRRSNAVAIGFHADQFEAQAVVGSSGA